MIELNLDWTSALLRVGPWQVRTWRSYVMKLPNGYRTPLHLYAVQYDDPLDGESIQLGVFFDLKVAEACMAQFEGDERYPGLGINYLIAHSRLKDWEWNR